MVVGQLAVVADRGLQLFELGLHRNPDAGRVGAARFSTTRCMSVSRSTALVSSSG
jgi:hypothetical protein